MCFILHPRQRQAKVLPSVSHCPAPATQLYTEHMRRAFALGPTQPLTKSALPIRHGEPPGSHWSQVRPPRNMRTGLKGMFTCTLSHQTWWVTEVWGWGGMMLLSRETTGISLPGCKGDQATRHFLQQNPFIFCSIALV